VVLGDVFMVRGLRWGFVSLVDGFGWIELTLIMFLRFNYADVVSFRYQIGIPFKI